VRECATHSLESEASYIFREAVAQARRPRLLYSVGESSSVPLRLARRAFHPGPVPFPLLLIDTDWKSGEIYAFRDRIVREHGLDPIVHRNEAAAAAGVNPFELSDYTDEMKTVPQGGWIAARLQGAHGRSEMSALAAAIIDR
jgi:sulfate adenylyltransferase subunit 2